MKSVVVALGGNALIHPNEMGTAERQIARVNETVLHLEPLTKAFTLVLTHGNGPQVGNLLLQQERSKEVVPEMPLDTLDAMTQGQLGYWIQQSVENILKKNAVTIVTRVLVDRNDPAFRHPTKPIGPYYEEKVFPSMVKLPQGWRRIVASPKPLSIVDIEEIVSLIKGDFVVIACGGGGIPVIMERGLFLGIEAVIDKDYSSAKLANQLGADDLIFLTDVPAVYRNYGQAGQQTIERMTVKEAEILLEAGEFAIGSMKPKIEASIDFLRGGGERVIITSVEEINNAIMSRGGTVLESGS